MLARRLGQARLPRGSNRFRRSLQTSSSGSSRQSLFQDAWSYTKIVIALGLGWHMFSEYGYSFDFTWGISMLPNLAAAGDAVILSKWYRHGRGIVVGDLVTFVHPVDEQARALKRVIGMPGDFVLRDSPHHGRQTMIQVPAGHCYVVGDNLDHSRDSRIYGPLPLALIKSKVLCKVTTEGTFFPWPRRIGGGLEEPQAFPEDDVD